MDLQTAATQMWPTPSATDPTKGARTTEGAIKEVERGKNSCLPAAAQAMWATPRTSMHKANGHEPSNLKRIAENGAVNIEEQAAERTNWKGWRLSVTFVEWLMGFPVGWSRKE